MPELVARDAAHRGANAGITSSLGLAHCHERAPSFAHAAFHRVFQRHVEQRAGLGSRALYLRNADAEAASQSARRAGVPALVASTAGGGSQQTTWRTVFPKLTAQQSKGVHAGGLEPGGVGEVARKTIRGSGLGLLQADRASPFARRRVGDAENGAVRLANARYELAVADVETSGAAAVGVEWRVANEAPIHGHE